MRERGKGTEPSVDERYTQWKSLVPVLYDWLANHNLVWPSLSCRSVHLYNLLYSILIGFFLDIYGFFMKVRCFSGLL